MGLPLNLNLSAMQTRWKALLDPFLENQSNSASVLTNVSLINGTNVINHKLGRVMQGWFITDQQGVASIYRPNTAPFNNLTLTLISSAAVTVNLGVF
jgi:hypothetical protein